MVFDTGELKTELDEVLAAPLDVVEVCTNRRGGLMERARRRGHRHL